MKKLVLGFLILSLFSTAKAQTADSVKTENAFKPGWYLGLHAGVNMFLGEGNNFITPSPYVFSLQKMLSPLARFSAEYKFSHLMGVRTMLGYNYHNWYTVSPLNPDGSYPTFGFSSESLTADFMFNISNLGGYDPNKKFDFSLFAGLGAAYMNNNKVAAPVAFLGRGGVQADFRLNPNWTLNMMLEGNITSDNYNDFVIGPLDVDFVTAFTVGCSYRLPEKQAKPKAETKPAIEEKKQLVDNTQATTEAKKDTVKVEKAPEKVATTAVETKKETAKTDTVATKAATASKTDAGVAKKKEIAVITVTNNGLDERLFFGSSKVVVSEDDHSKSLEKISEYAKQHPDAIITINGYADGTNGSAELNNRTSKERAVNVANALIRYYNVKYKNIRVMWYGAGVQPYLIHSKNRLVIVKSPAVAGSGSAATTGTEGTAAKPTATATAKVAASSTGVAPAYFNSVYFNKEVATVAVADQQTAIKEIAAYLNKYPETRILITGYADKAAGSSAKNTELAKQRANNVAAALMQQYKISSDRLEIKWLGTAQSSNTTSVSGVVLVEKIK